MISQDYSSEVAQEFSNKLHLVVSSTLGISIKKVQYGHCFYLSFFLSSVSSLMAIEMYKPMMIWITMTVTTAPPMAPLDWPRTPENQKEATTALTMELQSFLLIPLHNATAHSGLAVVLSKHTLF